MGNRLALFLGFLLIAVSVWAQDIPAKPDGYVLDLSGKLQSDEKLRWNKNYVAMRIRPPRNLQW